MTGLILNHTLCLLEAMRGHQELMKLKVKRMNDPDLSMHYRCQNGRDYVTLIQEYISYREELEELIDAYYTDPLIRELHRID